MFGHVSLYYIVSYNTDTQRTLAQVSSCPRLLLQWVLQWSEFDLKTQLGPVELEQ